MHDGSDTTQIRSLLSTIKDTKWRFRRFKSGKTNTIFLCTTDDLKVVARIFGKNTSSFINRAQEQTNISYLHTYGLAPRLMGSYDNGYLVDYVPGRELGEEELVRHYEVIARKIRKWHTIKCFGVPSLYKTLLDWYWKAHVHHKELLEKANVYDFIVEKERETKNCEVTFCHNDLLASNIITRSDKVFLGDLVSSESKDTTSSGEEIGNVDFIDFEYCGVNYAAYDVANHFAEYIGYSRDESKLPTESFKREFIQTYFYDGIKVNDKIAEQFLEDVNKFMPVSHCYWALWGLLRSEDKERDFDYLGYAKFKLGMLNYKK